MIDKELDLRNFINRIRLSTYSVLGLLTAKQRRFVDRSSQLVVHESSEVPNSSMEEGISKSSMLRLDLSIKSMLRNKNKTDQRFIDIYRLS